MAGRLGTENVPAAQRPDARRALQLGLAGVWLLDALLQYQPVMFSAAFGRMLAATATGNPGVVARSITWDAALTEHHAAALVSQPLPAAPGQVTASGTGPGGAAWVLLADRHAYGISGPGGTWRQLPAPPPGTAALAAGPGGAFDALAAKGGTLTVYRLSPAGAWDTFQTLSVPIQYGSSG